ncbi:MAG: septal ring lytic transglycosylase RlpA family protein [Hyphomicrobiaceae bacterium]|nr:septal ring lytic transglycosylase RlpA family protein [Hyphomicrobiaceae bacterium]
MLVMLAIGGLAGCANAPEPEPVEFGWVPSVTTAGHGAPHTVPGAGRSMVTGSNSPAVVARVPVRQPASVPLRQPASLGVLPKGGGYHKVGKPYEIAGQWYHPRHDPSYEESGTASWYGDAFHAKRTANGEIYDMHAMTAAHRTLPLPSIVRVTHLVNGRSVLVRVNDRGPFRKGRIIDLSRAAAEALGFHHHGTAPVRVTYVGPAPLDGSDHQERAANAAPQRSTQQR